MIGRGAQLGVGTSLLDMLVLRRNWAHVVFPTIVLFFWRRTRIDTAVPAIVTDAGFRDVFDSRVIGVVNDCFVHMICVCVVVKAIMIPAPAFIAVTPIAKSIVDTAIKSNVRPPIAFVPEVGAATPAPISGSPKETDFGCQDPGAGHPVIIISVPSPVAGCPDVAFSRTDRLLINRNGRRTK